MTLAVGDYVMLAAILTLPMGFVAFYLKTIRADAITFRNEFITRLEKIEDRVHDVEQSRVSHTQWVRIVGSLQSRQNRLSEQFSELEGKIDATIGLGASVNRLTGTIEKIMETAHG